MASSSCVQSSDWQLQVDTVLQRDTYILTHAQWTDWVFIVGAEGRTKEFPCHRVYLAKTSAVMAAMLYGGLKDKDGVTRILDIEPEAFEALLHYIYTGSLLLENLDTAFGLLHACKKYLLPESLRQVIRHEISEKMYPDFVWTALDFAQFNDEPEMLSEAMALVQQHTEPLLRSPEFLEVSGTTLTAVVRQEALNCSELTLYEGCLRWARGEAEREGLGEESRTLRDVLGPVFRHIRFLAMTPEQFAKGPVMDKLLTDSQCLSIYTKKFNPESGGCPEEICTNASPRNQVKRDASPKNQVKRDDDTFVASICVSSPDKIDFLIKSLSTRIFNLEEIMKTQAVAKITHDMFRTYLGIRVPTQIKPSGCTDDSYNEDMSVLHYHIENKFLISVKRFTKKVRYDSLIDIPYKGSRQFLPHNFYPYGSILINIIFHTPGRYPYNKKDKSSIDEADGELCRIIPYMRRKISFDHPKYILAVHY